ARASELPDRGELDVDRPLDQLLDGRLRLLEEVRLERGLDFLAYERKGLVIEGPLADPVVIGSCDIRRRAPRRLGKRARPRDFVAPPVDPFEGGVPRGHAAGKAIRWPGTDLHRAAAACAGRTQRMRRDPRLAGTAEIEGAAFGPRRD